MEKRETENDGNNYEQKIKNLKYESKWRMEGKKFGTIVQTKHFSFNRLAM